MDYPQAFHAVRVQDEPKGEDRRNKRRVHHAASICRPALCCSRRSSMSNPPPSIQLSWISAQTARVGLKHFTRPGRCVSESCPSSDTVGQDNVAPCIAGGVHTLQTLQIGHCLRVAKLRILLLGCHESLDCSRPDARRPPSAGLRKHAPGSIHAGPLKPR